MSEWRADELSESEMKAFASLPRAGAAGRDRGTDRRRAEEARRPPAMAATDGLGRAGMLPGVRRDGGDDRAPGSSSSSEPASPQPHWVLLLRESHEDRSVTAEESRRRVSEYASWARANRANGLIDGEKLGDEGVLFSGRSGHPSVRTSSRSPDTSCSERSTSEKRARLRSCPHLAYGGHRAEVDRNVRERPRRLLRQMGYVDPPTSTPRTWTTGGRTTNRPWSIESSRSHLSTCSSCLDAARRQLDREKRLRAFPFEGNWEGKSSQGWTDKVRFEKIARGSVLLETSLFEAHPGETMVTAVHPTATGCSSRITASRGTSRGSS